MFNTALPRSGNLSKASRADRRSLFTLALCSLLMLLVCLPVFPWISLPDTAALYEAMDLKKSVINKLSGDAFSIPAFLSFVQTSKQGILGLWSCILLLLTIAAGFFHIFGLGSYLLRARAKDETGLLPMFSRFQLGMGFSLAAALGTIGLTIFANTHYGMKGFSATLPVYLSAIVSPCAYALSKKMEKAERVIRHEHGLLEEIRRNWILFLFLAPCFIFFLINNYLPMVGVYFAFTQFNFRDHLFASPFVGFKNFEFLLRSEIIHLTQNTILYNLVFIIVGNVLQVFFAVLISYVGSKKLRKLSQTLIFMPYFVSYVILRVLVFNLFEYEVGLINNLLTSLGLAKIDFYNTPGYWPFLITIFYLWKNVGYGMVVYLATITGISSEYYEAAQIDGANILQQIRFITLPLLKPTFIILLLYALGGIMKGQFELFYQLVGTNGTLFNATDIFDTYVYRITTTQPMSMGLGTAAGLFQSLFGFVIIMATNFFIKRKNPEYALF